MLNKLNNTNERGFTIVELLIVIVVIAILAAISIVAYNGIQNRGKASSSQAAASQVAKKAQSYNTIQSSFPSNVAAFGTGPDESKLEGVSAVDYTSSNFNTAATYADGKTAVYRTLTGGGCVYWWDYAAATAIQKPIYFGNVTSGC